MSTNALRLTFLFASVWFLVLASLVFLHLTIVNKMQREHVSDLLRSDWNTMRGYLRIERGKPLWYADMSDPDEAVAVTRLRQTVSVFDPQGQVMERAPVYLDQAAFHELQRTPAATIWIAKDNHGKSLLWLGGALWDEDHSRQYYAYIGRSITREGHPFFLLALAALLSLVLSVPMVALSKRIELPSVKDVS